ncbi:plasmid mobilization protein [Qingrenia yutianensis]|uniref:Uncharacterized protein n=1 Tax=Qingrenia yutianensis TaxID=2763676 RepID=A0A926ITS4_9FIRM|nr:hypothetical protein [Qingrenia yutianensis]MBC8597406.1 hypothetical protein [Qingrenia yutianensis]
MDKIKISVRLTEQEHKRLKANAAACALKMEPYIRKHGILTAKRPLVSGNAPNTPPHG